MPKRDAIATTWPTRAAAAAELAVILERPTLTAETLAGWLGDPACPLPHGKGPIPKIPMLIWLVRHKREQGRPADLSTAAVKAAQAAILQAKASVLTGRSIPIEIARTAVEGAADNLRGRLLNDLPQLLVEARGKPEDEALESVRGLIMLIMNQFVEETRTKGASEGKIQP